jgi:hypothetical protein
MDNKYTLMEISKQELKSTIQIAPYITMSIEIYEELMAYVQHYKTEVSGCGMIEAIEHIIPAEDKDKASTTRIEYRITEVFLPNKQDNTGASTNIDDNTLQDLLFKLLSDKKDTNKLKLHWHSHADMGVFHSGTDEDNYDTLYNKEYLISLVINHAGDFLGRVDYYKPIYITMSGIPIYVYNKVDNSIYDKINNNIAELDKYIADKPTIGYRSYDSGYDSYYEGAITKDKPKINKHMRKRLRKECKIAKEQQDLFDSCEKVSCDGCEHFYACQQYLSAVDDVVYGGTEYADY